MMTLSSHVIHAEYKCMACNYSEYKIIANGGAWPLKAKQIKGHDDPYWHGHASGINKVLHRMGLVSIFKLDRDLHTSFHIEDMRSQYEKDTVII